MDLAGEIAVFRVISFSWNVTTGSSVVEVVEEWRCDDEDERSVGEVGMREDVE